MASTPLLADLDQSHVPPGFAGGNALPPGSRLSEFEILRVLGIGGFGIVYLAQDHALQRQVALKEYMPSSLASRGPGQMVSVFSIAHGDTYAVGLRSFVNEARLLARFDHPSLVKVHRFWEENGTAYMVMPYLQGRTLREARRSMTRAPDERWVRSVVDPLLDALERLHGEGVFHRDIAPDNILLVPPGDVPVLLDFGAARRAIGDSTQTFTAILKPSYAPIEQYAEVAQLRQGPWTDLYALGAVVHYLLRGEPPPPATARSVQDTGPLLPPAHNPHISPRFLAAFEWALAVSPANRPQSVALLREALDSERDAASAPGRKPAGAVADWRPLPEATGFAPTLPVERSPTFAATVPVERVPTFAATMPADLDYEPLGEAVIPPAASSTPAKAAPAAAAVAAASAQIAAPAASSAAEQPVGAARKPPPAASKPMPKSSAVRRASSAPRSSPTRRWAAGILGLAACAVVIGWMVLPRDPAAAPRAVGSGHPAVAAEPASDAMPASPAPVSTSPRESIPASIAPKSAEARQIVPPPKPALTPPRTTLRDGPSGRSPALAVGAVDRRVEPQAARPDPAPPEQPTPASVAPAVVTVDQKTPKPVETVQGPASSATVRATPREVCGNRGFLAQAACMDEVCVKPEFEHHPQCKQVLEMIERRKHGLDGGAGGDGGGDGS